MAAPAPRCPARLILWSAPPGATEAGAVGRGSALRSGYHVAAARGGPATNNPPARQPAPALSWAGMTSGSGATGGKAEAFASPVLLAASRPLGHFEACACSLSFYECRRISLGCVVSFQRTRNRHEAAWRSRRLAASAGLQSRANSCSCSRTWRWPPRIQQVRPGCEQMELEPGAPRENAECTRAPNSLGSMSSWRRCSRLCAPGRPDLPPAPF